MSTDPSPLEQWRSEQLRAKHFAVRVWSVVIFLCAVFWLFVLRALHAYFIGPAS